MGHLPKFRVSNDELDHPLGPPALPTRNNLVKEHSASPSVSSNASMASGSSSRKASISEDKENTEVSLAAINFEKAKQEKISVKERTKTFNRMASEVEVTNLLKQSAGEYRA